MDGRLTRTYCEEAGDYDVPNVLSPRDLVSRPDNMDETVLSSYNINKKKHPEMIGYTNSIMQLLIQTTLKNNIIML